MKNEITIREIWKFILAGYLMLFSLCFLFYQNFVFAALGGFLIIFGIKSYKKYLVAKRRTDMLLEFKDFLYGFSTNICLGVNIVIALKESVKYLERIYGMNSQLANAVKATIWEMENLRESEEAALKKLALGCGLEDLNDFTEVFIICRKSGGDLEKMVSKTSGVILEKINLEKEIKAAISQRKFEGKLITIMPIILILFLNLVSPEYLSILYDTFAGRIIMTVGLMGIVLSFFLTEKITSIEV